MSLSLAFFSNTFQDFNCGSVVPMRMVELSVDPPEHATRVAAAKALAMVMAAARRRKRRADMIDSLRFVFWGVSYAVIDIDRAF